MPLMQTYDMFATPESSKEILQQFSGEDERVQALCSFVMMLTWNYCAQTANELYDIDDPDAPPGALILPIK